MQRQACETKKIIVSSLNTILIETFKRFKVFLDPSTGNVFLDSIEDFSRPDPNIPTSQHRESSLRKFLRNLFHLNKSKSAMNESSGEFNIFLIYLEDSENEKVSI